MKVDKKFHNVDTSRDDFEKKYLLILSENIQRIRNERGLTLEKLGDKCNLTNNYLSKVCSTSQPTHRVPSLNALLRIAFVLDITPEELFRENTNPE